MDDPWTQTQYDEDPETQYDPFNGVCCVWISNFFTDATNLIYYIRGTRNVEMFCGGMAGMQVFNGPALFAITHSPLEAITQPIWPRPQDGPRPERLVKSRSPIEANKWRYIYETGRIVWGKSGIDLEKLGQAMEQSDDGESCRSREHHASDDGLNIDPQEDRIQRQCKSAASDSGQGKKVATLRGGSARSDSVVDTQSLRRSTRKKNQRPDYKSLNNGLDPWKQTEQYSTQASNEGATEVRPNKLQLTRSRSPSTSEPHTVHPSRVPGDLLAASSYDTASTSASTKASIPSEQEIGKLFETPTSSAPIASDPPNESRSHTQLPPNLLEESSWPSQLDLGDDQNLSGTKRSPSPKFNHQTPINYGASVDWQSNIDQSFQPARADTQRLRRVTDALNRGQITYERARNLFRDVHPGLRFQASGTLMLVPEDTEAAEVLGSLTTSREGVDLKDTSPPDAPSLVMAPDLFEDDSWLSAAIEQDRLYEEKEDSESQGL